VYISCLESLRDVLEEANICRAVATPDFIRSVLRSNSDKLLTLPITKAIVPSMFQYVISDITVRSPSSMLRLNALPLLPLCASAPPNVGVLRTYTDAQADAIQTVMGMGFTFIQAIIALEGNAFDTTRACDALMSAPSGSVANDGSSSYMYIIADDEELAVFSPASAILVDKKVYLLL